MADSLCIIVTVSALRICMWFSRSCLAMHQQPQVSAHRWSLFPVSAAASCRASKRLPPLRAFLQAHQQAQQQLVVLQA